MKKKFKNKEIEIKDRDKLSRSLIPDTICINEDFVDNKLNLSDNLPYPTCKDNCENLNNELKYSKFKELNRNEIILKEKYNFKELIINSRDEGTILSEEIDKDNVLIKKYQELSDSREDGDVKRIEINNFGRYEIKIPYNKINSELYLPSKMKKISHLYKIIETLYYFNANRNISFIFVEYTESIERLFKHRVEMIHLENLNYFCGDDILFQPITVMNKGCIVETYTIKIFKKVDIDKKLFDYLIREYSHCLDINKIKWSRNRFHPDFNADAVEMPTKLLPKINANFSLVPEKFVGVNDYKSNSKFQMKDNETFYEECKKRIRLKANDIFERMRKKEEERKRLFLQEKIF